LRVAKLRAQYDEKIASEESVPVLERLPFGMMRSSAPQRLPRRIPWKPGQWHVRSLSRVRRWLTIEIGEYIKEMCLVVVAGQNTASQTELNLFPDDTVSDFATSREEHQSFRTGFNG